MDGQDPVGRQHAVNVVRLGLGPNHDDLFLVLLGPAFRLVGIEGDLPDRRAGGDIQPAGDAFGFLTGGGFELRMQVEVNLLGLDPQHGFPARDQMFVGHVDRGPHFRLSRALGIARLQHPQLAALNGELDVLHVAIVLLQALRHPVELAVDLGHLLAQVGNGFGDANAGHDVLALGVRQEVAFDLLLPGGGVARHGHPGGRCGAHVAEDHGDDVDRRAQIVRDVSGVSVVDSSFAVPRLEDGFDRQTQLVQRIRGEVDADLRPDDGFEGVRQGSQLLGRKFRIGADTAALAGLREFLFEGLVRHAQDDGPVHLNQPPVGVVDETLVARQRHHSAGGVVVEADVEDGIHHPRHRELGAGSARDQERLGGIAEALAGLAFDGAQGLHRLGPQAGREGSATFEVGVAGLGRDGETRRNGHSDARHLRQVGALPA